MSNPKLNFKEDSSAKKTRSPPKKAKVEQSTPKKKKLKTDAEKVAEKKQHLRFGKAELTPDELSRLSKAQKREMYAAHAARSAVHQEIGQYEDDNVGTQALSEGEKAAENVRDISKGRYARKLKRKAKMVDMLVTWLVPRFVEVELTEIHTFVSKIIQYDLMNLCAMEMEEMESIEADCN